MREKVGKKTELVGDGTVLIAREEQPLAAGETLDIGPLDVGSFSGLGGDILSDRACTVTVIPLPDEGVEGAPSDTQAVAAGVPARWTYSLLYAPQVLVRVVNTGEADMASFLLTVRGDA